VTAILALAGHTVRELVRNKLLYLLLVFALALILTSVVLAQLTIGQRERVINDVGLATVQLSGALVAILVGVGLVAGEVDRRTVYVTLAKPVTRPQFIIGRYLGLCANLLLFVLVMGAALWATLFVCGYPMGATGLSALVLIAVELFVLAAFAVVFSSFTTPTLGVIFALSFFIIGHLAGDLAVFATRLPSPTGPLLAVLARVVPNLDLMNLKTLAANQLPVSAAYVASTIGYGLCYAAVAVGLASVIFSRRDLK
jgi:ABC-type transport system involved in multi-copper enzyme maturation permease subunit